MRPPRRFRPSTDTQESIAPISTLIPGLPAETPTATDVRTAEGEGDSESLTIQPGGAMANRPAPSISAPTIQPLAMAGIGTNGGEQRATGSSSTDASAVPVAPIRQPAPDPATFGNLIALATPSAAPDDAGLEGARPPAVLGAAQPLSGASMGVGAPTANSNPVSSGHVTSATVPAAKVKPGPTPRATRRVARCRSVGSRTSNPAVREATTRSRVTPGRAMVLLTQATPRRQPARPHRLA